MKWVQIDPQRYKLVNDDDPRPKVILKDRKGIPFIKYSPSWRKYEQNYWIADSEKKSDDKISDQFLAEREHQMRTDPIARRWEESRKAHWAKEKPAWRKKMIKEGVIT